MQFTAQMNFFLYGILLGLGAAIPIGPVNLEITRRNLNYGLRYGVVFGIGACLSDLTYLILLSLGILTLLSHPLFLKAIGLFGSFILAYFGVMAFQMHAHLKKDPHKKGSLLGNCIQGYLMTLINPFNILFWASITSQLASMAATSDKAIYSAGGGIIMGAGGWVMALNIVLHYTRHKFSNNVMKWLNRAGGVIMFAFAIIGFIHALRI